MNHIKAYILGLLVGGGKIDVNTFIIDLPFKKWGMDPKRMNMIASDILTKICNNFNSTYNFSVTYEIGNSKWLIKPINDADISPLINDLIEYNLPTGGFLLNSVDLTEIKKQLTGINVESFLSGIFDTRASLTLSHRRFNDNAPVVSVEIPGSTKNFRFVVQLCSWLTDLGSITDQILYNHPNQHSGSDPNYTGWKKGFKIRFLVKSFLAQHSFALQAKATDINQIEKNQIKEEQLPCYLRKLGIVNPISIHSQQGSTELPEEVKNKIFFHYHHFCAVLQCPHAPYAEIEKLVNNKEAFINFFPRLSKGNFDELEEVLLSIHISSFPTMEISYSKKRIGKIVESGIFKSFSGIDLGIAYLFAPELNGKRHKGSMETIIQGNLEQVVNVMSIGEDFDSPVLISNPINNRAFISSSVNNSLNQSLIKKRISTSGLTINLLENE